MFYCREKELMKLNNRYTNNAFECIIIYGRRRVGKTALINEFCKDKPTIYFSALNAPAHRNLRHLSEAIQLFKDAGSASAPEYRTFEDALSEITHLGQQERLVFVIDEYPYLAKSDMAFSSLLQHIIDHKWADSKIYLILCGSSMSFMEKQVLGHESPLYGRRTGQFKIEPLTYKETALFSPECSFQENALIYGITGGVPHYINKLNIGDDVDGALLDNMFDRSSYLYEEPENLLKQELREPSQYSDILAAIAGGASKMNEIASQCKMDTGACSKYLNSLMELGVVKREFPFSNANSRKTIYSIDDSFFRFWYRFVPDNIALIQSGRISQLYDKVIKPYLNDFMGQVFERMCKDYLLYYANELPFEVLSIGRWWGNDPTEKKEIEIDIVGEVIEKTSGEKAYLAVSCKYRNTVIGRDELELLKHYASVFSHGQKCYYMIFSKCGFTKGLQTAASNGEVTLVQLNDMF
ncbi:ATP-binding protein [Anaerovibrio sp. RM50]|uniref:ATP-binding protein n=1 Tax=Anaerovibrio sp. RM50 TaxID=1200557 RepID=UPI00048A291E|nr:ATP-binding protein [Anaerovibrio sp. RM50]